MGDLADLNARTRTSTAQIDFSASDRKTKRLIELEDVACEIENRTLFEKLNFILTAGMRVGLVGPNGSGKTTLLRLLRGERTATSETFAGPNGCRIVYFDQTRELDSSVTLRRALAPEGDSVTYQDRVTHVASWRHVSCLRANSSISPSNGFRRRTRAGADRATHAPTCRCVVAG